MSYEVTATRRRPQQFDDLVGQEFVAQTLKNSIKTNKIAHAYLFSGPRGCGKTSTARILARALNCQNGPTDVPCGVCANCKEITQGSSLDVIEIDGASNPNVENIRQIKDEVQFQPNTSRYKIYIIDEVHMLSTSAFNALLKTIEEPPSYVVFIFATTELQKVPATIKSRCQQYNFRLVPIEKVKQCLSDAATEMNIKADDEALFWIARESTGSMRDSYTLFDQVVAFSDGHITYEKIKDKLGLVGIDRLNEIIESCVQNNTQQVISMLDDFLQSGISIEQLISNTADFLRSLLLIKNGIKSEALLGNSAERFSNVVLSSWNSIQIERGLSIFLELYRDIRYSLSPRYELELAFSRLCWLGQYVSNLEVKKAIDAAQVLLGGAKKANEVVQGLSASQDKNSSYNGDSQKKLTSSSNSTATKMPNGLPRLSGLDKEEDANLNNSFSDIDAAFDGTNNQGANRPFYNGGPLPPEQSVETESKEVVGQAEIDERLRFKVATEEQNVQSNVVYIPKSESYTYNPDDADDSNDGWSNISEEEVYSPSLEDFPEDFDETDSSNIEHIQIENNSSKVDEMIQTADGRTISMAQLRGSVIAGLAVGQNFVSVALDQTDKWKLEGNVIKTTVTSEYNYSLITKNIVYVNKELTSAFGGSLEMKVSLKKENEIIQNETELPLQVKILIDTFKGMIK